MSYSSGSFPKYHRANWKIPLSNSALVQILPDTTTFIAFQTHDKLCRALMMDNWMFLGFNVHILFFFDRLAFYSCSQQTLLNVPSQILQHYGMSGFRPWAFGHAGVCPTWSHPPLELQCRIPCWSILPLPSLKLTMLTLYLLTSDGGTKHQQWIPIMGPRGIKCQINIHLGVRGGGCGLELSSETVFYPIYFTPCCRI